MLWIGCEPVSLVHVSTVTVTINISSWLCNSATSKPKKRPSWPDRRAQISSQIKIPARRNQHFGRVWSWAHPYQHVAGPPQSCPGHREDQFIGSQPAFRTAARNANTRPFACHRWRGTTMPSSAVTPSSWRRHIWPPWSKQGSCSLDPCGISTECLSYRHGWCLYSHDVDLSPVWQQDSGSGEHVSMTTSTLFNKITTPTLTQEWGVGHENQGMLN
jgi:hypothetical protein